MFKHPFSIVLVALALLNAHLSSSQSADIKRVNWKKVSTLLHTKNGKGYVHDNIPSAVECFKKMAQQYGFALEASDDPSKFTVDNLKKYSVLIFASTNNDVFDTDEQRLAFRKYIEGGGGFVGLHSVIGTERNWSWFKMMLGGSFAWHPPFQKYKIVSIDPQHASVAGLPKVWEKEDECYFMKELYPGIRPVMAHDLSKLSEAEKEKITTAAGFYSTLYPAVWHQQFDGGTIWITALGHDKKDYSDATFVQHIFQGVRFVAAQSSIPDFKKAYATTKDDAVRY
jgi:uncharacterized protein